MGAVEKDIETDLFTKGIIEVVMQGLFILRDTWLLEKDELDRISNAITSVHEIIESRIDL